MVELSEIETEMPGRLEEKNDPLFDEADDTEAWRCRPDEDGVRKRMLRVGLIGDAYEIDVRSEWPE